MPRVRRRADIAERWQRRAGQAAQDYVAGAQQPRRDWAEATQAAEDAWQQGVQEAMAERRFGQGVQQAGTQKWQQGIQQKGQRRFAEGVQVAQSAYERGVQPYLDAIEATELPPRRARGDPANIERVARIAQALHETKRRLRRGGG